MPVINDFNTVCGLIERGAFSREINAKFDELRQELGDRLMLSPKAKAKGKITVEVEFTFAEGVAQIDGRVKMTPPKKDPARALLFITGDNRLTTEHPTQMDMFKVREVERETTTA